MPTVEGGSIHPPPVTLGSFRCPGCRKEKPIKGMRLCQSCLGERPLCESCHSAHMRTFHDQEVLFWQSPKP